MVGGTSRDGCCYPINEISNRLPHLLKDNLIGFHALPLCGATSSFAGFGKKTAWKIFKQHSELLENIGRNGKMSAVEQFVCQCIKHHGCGGGDVARHELFRKGKVELDKLPPTSDSLQLYLARANY